ncbi:cytochrome b [Ehrlichia chaffeensis str. Heartland]|uniref:Cytochrome b n=1 Tax=Ehrlichia chaffeensis (strain ATCC CRL-10679 / Arkansas) TaxID=205920 RepID=Q2GGU7_EHRCR|nr:cytochrome b/b6 [Ehrlichia chaffeensis]ABD45567.1 ubiquinol-cytochrome c reductase, cytochrome b [Ehrlichia chaffeensis str. Arkansas]AHX03615.1 cytochrome b [Ehrlichia chaffeensis str. Heartland]AHX05663.1 cytochrome b [Ehrlichia chaffeensis str. Jax]AHX06654.1 cytochrome b [Ehrlichia chaffeensis str. Liberty]AHX07380.1 cytochrome b [Ehrlichia chaffeensis str. Osceola]
MSEHDNIKKTEGRGIRAWIEYRMPIGAFLKELASYQVPKNLNYAWNFGSLAGIALMLQIITGIFLAMHYTPHVAHAFSSVERIMRDVNYGWLIRYTHAVGASFFFIVVYIHILRGLYYGSYKSPRELVWFVGIFIFFAMMATAFMGYVLPWGQMSFWGATVITNLFSVIPLIGQDVVQWLWGGFSVDNPTLNRFFALHYLLPFIIVMLASLHVIALHRFGSGNPSGIEVKSSKDTIPIYPYFIVKDCITFGIFFILLFLFVFYIPNYLGHPDNYIEADPMVTPAHIVPEWYFLPFYAMLRSIPNKLLGVVTMIGSIAVWFLLPVLDKCKVKSGSHRPIFRIFYLFFVVNFCFLAWLGGQEVREPFVTLSRLSTLYYFSYFFIVLPILSKYEKPVVLPKTISDAVPEMK